MVDAPTLSNWYDLLSRVLSDLRTEGAKRRRARLENFSSLFQLIKTVHADYVGMFVALREGCIRDHSAEAMKARKDDFFLARTRHAGDRTLLYLDIRALREVHDASDSAEEKQFLAAVENYLSAYQAPSDASGVSEENFYQFGFLADRSNTLSGLLWSRISATENPAEITDAVEKALHWLGQSYSGVVTAYSALGGRSSLLASEPSRRDAPRQGEKGLGSDGRQDV